MNQTHIFTCSVVYFPGFGGNFLKLCLSLSPEITPYYTQDLSKLNDFQCLQLHKMTAEQRRTIIDFNSYDQYKKIHNTHPGIIEPSIYYDNPLINNYYKWSIVANHPDNLNDRLPWIKKILYIKLDLEKYASWIIQSQKFFKDNFLFFPNQPSSITFNQLSNTQMQDEINIISLPMSHVISMTDILDSQQKFELQYQQACDILQISPVMDQALILYKNWRKIRVDSFLN